MAATPKNAVFVFLGVNGNPPKSYNIDAYFSDVDGAAVRFDSTGDGAGSDSDTFWMPPEPVLLIDVAITTGMADTTKAALVRNGIPTGHTLRYVPHVDSVAKRPALSVGFLPGQRVGAVQRA